MKTSHENIKKIQDYLDSNNLEISFDIDFVLNIYKHVLLSEFKISESLSLVTRSRITKQQYKFIVRDLLKILYIKNGNSAKNIKQGFVYAITNPAWPDYVKVGSAIDAEDRLSSYQTSSPKRDYTLEKFVFVLNRVEFEKSLHNKFDCDGEWVKDDLDTVIKEFEIVENAFDVQIEEFCRNEIKEKLSQSVDVLSQSNNKRKLVKFWSISKHLLRKENQEIENISEYIVKNKAWSFQYKDDDKVVYICKKFNITGEVYSDRVTLQFS
jgi:hypothetical protein